MISSSNVEVTPEVARLGLGLETQESLTSSKEENFKDDLNDMGFDGSSDGSSKTSSWDDVSPEEGNITFGTKDFVNGSKNDLVSAPDTARKQEGDWEDWE